MEFSLENRKARNWEQKIEDRLFGLLPCVRLAFGWYLVQLQHGLGLLPAPHVSRQEVSNTAQVRRPGLLRGHGFRGEQNSSAVRLEVASVPSGPSAKTSGSRRGKSDRVPAGRRSCRRQQEFRGAGEALGQPKPDWHQQQPKYRAAATSNSAIFQFNDL